MKIVCLIFGHNWSKWKYIKAIGRYDEKLMRTCKRCSNDDFYVGSTEYDKEGNKIPS